MVEVIIFSDPKFPLFLPSAVYLFQATLETSATASRVGYFASIITWYIIWGIYARFGKNMADYS